jgi:cobalt-zinc-cadmium resistance protein CzcA
LNIALAPLHKLELQLKDFAQNAGILLYDEKNMLFKVKSGFEKQQLLPDISIDYFQGTNTGLGENLYGYQVGLKIPLLFFGNASRIKASKIAKDVAIEESLDYKNRLQLKYEQLMGQLRKYEETLKYYKNSGQNLSDEILKTASLSFQNGEIDFFQYIQSLENAYSITLSYLKNLNNYNQTVIALNHLTL